MNTPSHPTAEPIAGEPPRDVFIDWLRIIALALLILFHVGMAYVSWPWHAKSVSATPSLAAWVEPWMRLTAPWRMTLLFVVSGLATSLMLQRRAAAADAATGIGIGGAAKGWLRQRAARLLLPLVTGVVLIVPPQAYVEVQQFHGYAGSYLDFLGLYFTGYRGFCAPGRGCLILPTWNHLWFLPYLFVYTAGLALVLRRWPQALERAASHLPRWLAGSRLWLLPLAWLALTRLALQPLFGETHAFFDDLFLHAQFAVAFAFGVLLACATTGAPATPTTPAALASRASPATPVAPMWPRIESARHLALLLTLLCWAVLISTEPGAWRALPWSLMQWCGVLAALGYARRQLRRDSALRRRLSDAVFPVYLLHQTVIVLGVVTLAPWRLHPAVEAAALVALTLGLSWLGYEVVRRIGRLRPWFGIAGRGAAQGALMRVMASRTST